MSTSSDMTYAEQERGSESGESVSEDGGSESGESASEDGGSESGESASEDGGSESGESVSEDGGSESGESASEDGASFNGTVEGMEMSEDKQSMEGEFRTGDTIILPDANWEGYTFLGWYDAAEGGNLIGTGGEEYILSDNIELYAHWERIGLTSSEANQLLDGLASVIIQAQTTEDEVSSEIESKDEADSAMTEVESP